MIGQLYKNFYVYELILCKPNKNRTQIAYINFTDLSFNPRFRDIPTLKFTVNYLEPVPNGKIVNPSFNDIKGNYFVLMNIKNYNTEEIISSRYYLIENPTLLGVEKDSKELYCYSLEYQLNKRILRAYNEVTLLYDNVGSSGLLNYMIGQLKGGWVLGTIPSTLLNQTRIFNYANNSYMEVFRDIEKVFSCVFDFDTLTNTINIKMLDDVGTNYGLFISEENYMKSLSREEKFEQIVTKLYVYGANNLGLYTRNITGQGYLLDVSYFRNSDYMSQSLLNALDAYDTVLENNKGTFQGYLDSLDTYNAQILTKQNELVDLNTALLVIQQNENAEIIESGSTGQTYSYWYTQEQAQKTLITNKQAEIDTIKSNITTINNSILTLNNIVSLESNFTADQLKELSNFILEDSLSISEIDDEALLMEEALYQIGKKSTPPLDFKIDIADIFSIPQAEQYWNKINMGDFINIEYSKYNINCQAVRLVAYTHEPLNNSLTLEFSTTDKYNSDNFYNVQVWQKANQTTNTVSVERPNYNKYVNDKSNILTKSSTINSGNNQIVLPDGSVIGSNGLQMHDSPSSNNQMRILGDRILFTNNNWATVGVGISGNGINADYIKVGTLKGITLIGNTIKTAATGSRLELSSENGFVQLDSSGNKTLEIPAQAYEGLSGGRIGFFASGTFLGFIGIIGSDIQLFNALGHDLYIGGYSTDNIVIVGKVDCSYAIFTNLNDGRDYYVTTAYAAQKGISTGSDSHSHSIEIDGVTYSTSTNSHSHTQY